MREITIDAERRPVKAKGNQLRAQGKIPAIFYGTGMEGVSLSISAKTMETILRKREEKHLINLRLDGKEDPNTHAIIKEIQKNVLSGQVLHIDFLHVDMDKKIRVDVPVEFVGEAVGVKTGGGILQILHRTLTVECLPRDIPEKITVDVTNINVGHSMHVSDLNIPELAIVTAKEEVLATVTIPKEEVVEVAATEAVVGEPEIIGEKGIKEDAEEGAEGAEGAAKGKDAPKGKDAAKDAKPEKKAEKKSDKK